MKIRQTFTYEGKRYDIRANDWIEFSRKVLNAIENPNKSSINTNQWFEEWLDIYKSSRSLRTISSYKQRYYKHISVFIGDKDIAEVTQQDCQKIMNSTVGLGKDTIKKIYLDLDQLFTRAYELEIITKNPCTLIEIPNGKSERRRCLTEEELEHFFGLVNKTNSALPYLLMLMTGMRPHELPSFSTSDVSGHVLHIKGSKTEHSDRYVPLTDIILSRSEEIEELARQLNTESKRAKHWKSFKQKYWKDTDLVPYCFRHTYATMLQQVGTPTNVIRELLGHTNLNTTQNYLHNFCHDFEELEPKLVLWCAPWSRDERSDFRP